jgi:hypothetical protein
MSTFDFLTDIELDPRPTPAMFNDRRKIKQTPTCYICGYGFAPHKQGVEDTALVRLNEKEDLLIHYECKVFINEI